MSVRRVLSFPAAACIAALLVFGAAPASAAASCDRYADPAGSDTAGGGPTDPFRTVQKLADSLAPGQVGCLRNGTYPGDQVSGDGYRELEVSQPGVTLTSAPGEQALISGRVYIPAEADGVTIENVSLDGANTRLLPSPTVNADDTVFRNNDVTNNHTGICFLIGSLGYGTAHRTLLESNRIHDCGQIPSTNKHHGVYVSQAYDTEIRGNWIYGNADRGIQLYPNAQRSTISGNVIYGNGEGIIFSGDAGAAASDNLVQKNIISNSTIRHNVESYYDPGAPVGTNNIVRYNCVAGVSGPDFAGADQSGIQHPEIGFQAEDNLSANPKFLNAAAGDFRLAAGSPCANLGAKVKLRPLRRSVGRRLSLKGKLPGSHSARVTFELRHGGKWQKIGSRKVGSKKFTVRLRVPRSMAGGRVKLRAKAPGRAPSRRVTVKMPGR